MSAGIWRPGDAIVRREVWRGRPVCGWAGVVACDDGDLLALWMPSGSPLTVANDYFGAPHPWSPRTQWQGPGVLQLQRRGDPYSVWHGDGTDLTAEEVAAVREEGVRIAEDLEAGHRWWSDDWLLWEPDPAWRMPALPADWDSRNP
jgi:hypothetical protein